MCIGGKLNMNIGGTSQQPAAHTLDDDLNALGVLEVQRLYAHARRMARKTLKRPKHSGWEDDAVQEAMVRALRQRDPTKRRATIDRVINREARRARKDPVEVPAGLRP